MNTVPDLQPEDRAKLLANNVERQKLRARQREIQARLEELDQQDNEILTKAVRREYTESEPKLNLLVFKDKTLLLLSRLLDAPDRMLSKDDIRDTVIYGNDAPGATVRTVIHRARQDMKACSDCRYEIKTVWGKGYRLVCKDLFQSVSNSQKTQKKRYKKIETV